MALQPKICVTAIIIIIIIYSVIATEDEKSNHWVQTGSSKNLRLTCKNRPICKSSTKMNKNTFLNTQI